MKIIFKERWGNLLNCWVKIGKWYHVAIADGHLYIDGRKVI